MVFCSIVWVYMLTSADTIKEGWQKLKLGEICEILSGGTPDSTKSEYWDNGDINWITLPDQHQKYIFDTQRKITKLGLQKSSAKLLPINSVIFSSRATLGEVSIIKVPASTNQGSKNFVCNSEKVFYEFLYYALKSKVPEIINLASGATYKEINKTVFSNFEILLPSLSEQKKIADILSAYDDLIEVNQKKIKVLENIAQSIYKEWFVKPIQNGIPEGWEVKKVEDFSFIISRGPSLIYLPEGGIPVINQRCVRDGLIKLEAIQYAQPLKNKNEHMYLNMYDCLVNSMGVGTLGRVSRNLNIKEKSIIHNCITLVRSRNPRIESAFLFYFIKSQEQYLTNMGIGATGQTSLNPEVIKKLEIMIPKYFLLERFSELIMPLWDDIGILLQKQENLQKTRDLLIPKLVSGKIDLK